MPNQGILIEDGRGTKFDCLRLRLGSVAASLPPNGSHQFFNRTLAMNTERFAGVSHHEARQALVLSIAGVTAIMLIANFILLVLY